MTETYVADGLAAAFATHPGRIRTNNEDLPLVDAARGIYGVIDGIGGQAGGEIAAGIARDVILQRLARPLGTPAERVREAIAIANNEIHGRAESAPELRGMAAVVTLALVADRTLTIGHVGDSRLYKCGVDGIRKLTHDHSPVGEREDARELSEVEAMRHPRRNEVFRDIGSQRRDKDEEEFVEVIEESFEPDCAILLCSDGLTDMVASAVIERIVRRLAGNPQAVTEALVAAANEAGGRDNVTVVYAEGPAFAAAIRPSATPAPDREGTAAPAVAAEKVERPGVVKRVVRSRTTWFSVGALAGVVAALVLAWRVGVTTAEPSRTLRVGGTGPAAFARITDAMAEARFGDQIIVEPGVYRERVNLRDGVDLAARISRTVTVGRPSNASGEVIALTMYGGTCGKVTGIDVESTPDQPIDVGVRVAGQGCTLDALKFSGEMRAGIEVSPAASVLVSNSQFAVRGHAASLGDESSATLISNTLLNVSRPAVGPLALAPSSQATLQQNVFGGFGADLMKGMAPGPKQQLLAGNYVIASEPSLLR